MESLPLQEVMATTPSASRQKIVVIEDHPFLRDQLIEFVNRQPGMVCSGFAGMPEEVFKAIEESAPSLAIMDLRLGNFEMLRTLPRLRAAFPWLYIVVLTQYDAPGFSELALRAGADAFLTKSEATAKLIDQIQVLLSSNRRAQVG